MKQFLSYSIIAILLFTFSVPVFSQTAPALNSAARYVLFTGAGELKCTSASANATGDAGNETGADNAFPIGTLNGVKHIGDANAIQANIDVTNAYADLVSRTCDASHGVGFGGGETITPGVYCATAASTLNGALTFDAGGNSAAVFIIKIDGQFSAASGSQINLLGGASACNIFWQINGAVDLNNTDFKGTMLVNGAISLNTGTILSGRALTKTGALIFDDINATLCDLSLLPIKLTNFDAAKTPANNVQLTWTTASEVNMARYEIEASINANAFYKAGSVASKGNNFPTQYTYQDADMNKTGVRFYRIKTIEKDGSYAYSGVKSVKFSDVKSGVINIFPNPAVNTINITVNSEARENVTLSIVNMHGQKVMQKTLLLNKGMNNIVEDVHSLTKSGYIVSVKTISGKESRQNFQKL